MRRSLPGSPFAGYPPGECWKGYRARCRRRCRCPCRNKNAPGSSGTFVLNAHLAHARHHRAGYGQVPGQLDQDGGQGHRGGHDARADRGHGETDITEFAEELRSGLLCPLHDCHVDWIEWLNKRVYCCRRRGPVSPSASAMRAGRKRRRRGLRVC